MTIDMKNQAGRTGFRHKRIDPGTRPDDGEGTGSDSDKRHQGRFIVQRGNDTAQWAIIRTVHGPNGRVDKYITDATAPDGRVDEGWTRAAVRYLRSEVFGQRASGGWPIEDGQAPADAVEAVED